MCSCVLCSRHTSSSMRTPGGTSFQDALSTPHEWKSDSSRASCNRIQFGTMCRYNHIPPYYHQHPGYKCSTALVVLSRGFLSASNAAPTLTGAPSPAPGHLPVLDTQ